MEDVEGVSDDALFPHGRKDELIRSTPYGDFLDVELGSMPPELRAHAFDVPVATRGPRVWGRVCPRCGARPGRPCVYTSDNNIHRDPESQVYVDNIVGGPTLITHPERGARVRQDWVNRERSKHNLPPLQMEEEVSGEGMTKAAAMAMAAAAGEALAAYQALENKYGKEPVEGSVIKFTKVWQNNGLPQSDPRFLSREFSYAAIRANNFWYTTGPHSPKGYDWESLMRWMDTDVPVSDLEIATAWISQHYVAEVTGPQANEVEEKEER
jgi:hypothetical protein